MSYLKLAEHYDKCFQKYGDSNLGVDWPNYEDTLTRHQVMFDLIKDKNSTLLDFGCGLGHFFKWMSETQNYMPTYSGLDINKSFYHTCRDKYPFLNFYHTDILIDDNIPNFDYIVCNGTFTEKRELSQEEMMSFFQSVLIKLWDKCDKGIAFNVMSKFVDWERQDLFHVSLDELCWFLKRNLSKEFVIRNDYGLYEYTIYVYKK
jgi:SAM-dependent methyltransferase